MGDTSLASLLLLKNQPDYDIDITVTICQHLPLPLNHKLIRSPIILFLETLLGACVGMHYTLCQDEQYQVILLPESAMRKCRTVHLPHQAALPCSKKTKLSGNINDQQQESIFLELLISINCRNAFLGLCLKVFTSEFQFQFFPSACMV